MNTIKDNARVFFDEKFNYSRQISSNIIIKFTNKYLIIYVGNHYFYKVYEAPFDIAYLSGDGWLDSRYFSNLFQKIFAALKINLKSFNVNVILSPEWILQYNLFLCSLEDHHLEREAILYFQHTNFININEYEFLLDKKMQRAAAVKKRLLQNLRECFSLPVQFILDNLEDLL